MPSRAGKVPVVIKIYLERSLFTTSLPEKEEGVEVKPKGFNILTGMFGRGGYRETLLNHTIKPIVAARPSSRQNGMGAERHLRSAYTVSRANQTISVRMPVRVRTAFIERVQSLLAPGFTIRKSVCTEHFAIYRLGEPYLSTANPGGLVPTDDGARHSKQFIFSAPETVFNDWVLFRLPKE
jgi:hypothetical protein